jgi:cytochrome P450
LLLAAGLETTASLIGGGVRLLLEHPEEKARLLKNPALIGSALGEMLRLVTPSRYMKRTVTAETELAGERLAEGDTVLMNFRVAHFDPRIYPEPFRFDVGRNPGQLLTFSVGPHRCAGINVAKLMARVAFEELLRRFPGLTLAGEVTYRETLATPWIERFPVVFSR